MLLGAVNCGKVTRECVAGKGCLVWLVKQTHLGATSGLPGMRGGSTSLSVCHLLREVDALLLGRKGEQRELFLCLLFLSCPSLTIIPVPK